ncbi:MAG: dihydroorotate dehydrogenase electron transfer subunit, partial [Chloroflexia bacterium]|nr:dihydroorotate dehydrogenase electron transfer subunit [Chloroflexia bacterium]
MSLQTARLLSSQQVMPATFCLRLQSPNLAHAGQAGQFVMVRCRDAAAHDPFLNRPLALHRIDRQRGEIDLLVRVVGRGTAWLA